jgi:hypothetical protein
VHGRGGQAELVADSAELRRLRAQTDDFAHDSYGAQLNWQTRVLMSRE